MKYKFKGIFVPNIQLYVLFYILNNAYVALNIDNETVYKSNAIRILFFDNSCLYAITLQGMF